MAEAERVIVTGSNIPTAEEVGPVPVDTYRPEDIHKLGARTATDLTQRLPAITGGAFNENITGSLDGRTEINLRGLLPKETLVLVDGKRVAPVGGVLQGVSVDLNLIPWPVVDHIDILKDGASAIYGSDAIAGVFNIILKHKFRGLEIEGSVGNTNLGSSNDAAEREGYLLAGAGDDKTDIVVFAQYYDRAAIFSRDRDLSSNGDFSKFGGIPNPVPPVPGVSFFTLRPGLSAPTPHSAPNAATSSEYVPTSSLPRKDRAFNGAAFRAAIPAADRECFYGSFTRDLCQKYLTVFGDFKIARAFYEPVLEPVAFIPDPFTRADGFTPLSPFGFSVPLSNPFNPFTQPDAFLPDGTPVTTAVRYRALEAGPRTGRTTTYDYLFDGGLRGSLGELGEYFKNWNYEIGFRYNSNDHQLLLSGLVSKPGLRAALLDTNPATAFNPFTRTGNTPAALSRVIITTHETGLATLTDESLGLNGDIIKMPAGPLSFALGSEHRKETVNDQPDSLSTTFSTIGGIDLEATRASRDVWSYYGELRIPVTSPAWNVPGLHSLEFQAAERVEFYSDTNLAERPKFSVRYQPFDSSLTLRASYTEAFHAPNLSDLSPSAAEQINVFFDPANPGAGPRFVRTLFGGQPNLRPEVAYGWSYGAVWTPRFVPGLTLLLDFYHIDLRDRTNFVEPQFLIIQNFFSRGRQFPGQVVRDAGGNIILVRDLTQNISRTITEGIDYGAIYRFETAILGKGNFGTFTFTLNGNYLSRYVAAIGAGDKELEYAGQQTGFDFGYLPHHKLYVSVYYDLGGLDTGVTLHYISQGSDLPFSTGADQRVNIAPGAPDPFPRKIREWITLDALVSYTFNFSAPVTENAIAGYAKDGGKVVKAEDGKNKTTLPVSTAAYSQCGWRSWLNGTTLTVGMNNIFDRDPPFSAGAFENGYDESTFDIKGRFWYVSLKKRF
jgi:iron complex outermembrane receptor protein